MYALQCMSCARYYNIIHNTNNRVSLRLVQYWQCDQLKMKCSSSLTLSLKSFSSSSLFCSASLHRSTTSPQSFSSSHLRNFFLASSNNLFSRTSATAAPPTPPDTSPIPPPINAAANNPAGPNEDPTRRAPTPAPPAPLVLHQLLL